MINTAPETLKRQWQMLRLIPRHPKHITATEMQQQLEREQFTVTKRTVERDLQALSAVFPLRLDERSKPFGWSWKEDATNFNVPGFSDNEALTFVMVEQHLKSLLPTFTLAQLQPYFSEAQKHLSDIQKQNKRMPSWLDKVRTVPPAQPLLPSPVNPNVQQAVYGALLADKQIDIEYMKRGEDKKSCYRVHPLAIVQRGPVSYLCCHINGKNELVALSRYQSTTVIYLRK